MAIRDLESKATNLGFVISARLQNPCGTDCPSFITGNSSIRMVIAHSKLTAQEQISIPSEVRRKLGIGPGSILEWDEDGEQIVVRRVDRYISEEVYRTLFPKPPTPRTLVEMKAGVRRYMKGRYARC